MAPEQPGSPSVDQASWSDAPWGAITGLIGELRSGHDGLTDFVEQLLGEVDAVRLRLGQAEQELGSERQEHARYCEELIQRHAQLNPAGDLTEESLERAAEWEQHRALLEAELAATQERAEAWQQQRSVLETELQTAQQQLIEWQQERQKLEGELETAGQQVGTWHGERAKLEQELSSLRQQVIQWEGDRRAAETEILQLRAARQEPVAWQQDRSTLIEELEALRRHAAEWQDERSTLEGELETVRGRAAEMAQTVAEQKRQMAEERAEWTGELKHLRRVLEKQAESLAQRAQAAQAAAAAVARHADAPPVTVGKQADPVLGSVMAQFEHLQRDIQRRRGQQRS